MDIMEIILLLVGGVLFVLSFFIPDKKAADVDAKELTEEEVRTIVSREVASVKSQVENLMDKTERSLEKLSNEKIMAVEEYSDTVLAQIRKNHEEAVFLYDMLNNKQISLKNGVAEITRTVKEAKDAAATLEKLGNKSVASKEKEDEKAFSAVLSPAALPPAWEPEKNSGKKESVQPEMPLKSRQEEKTAPQGILSGQQTKEDGHNNNEKILGLYRQGKNAAAIAKELGLGVGEVRLVIDLFQN